VETSDDEGDGDDEKEPKKISGIDEQVKRLNALLAESKIDVAEWQLRTQVEG
jgi:hypothetical protein